MCGIVRRGLISIRWGELLRLIYAENVMKYNKEDEIPLIPNAKSLKELRKTKA
ncbi:hypothetical protein GCM10011391_17890 [Pullulanibacillus camelliae]|uniref:Uncharacterized protein n=1 Tax=Pullulanibacillus camelliae TaxID=1707096 RepID=A0A8J2VS06_9BACL|nr:hypothetical protein GCM10011391_17890 [Pullulanibacillus camelliae]